jgi:PAS domain S-box-containing protein
MDILNQIPDLVFLVEPVNFELVYTNASFRQRLGYTETRQPVHSLRQIVGSGQESLLEAVHRVLQTHQPLVVPILLQPLEGSTQAVEISLSVIIQAGCELVCAVGRPMTEDVCEADWEQVRAGSAPGPHPGSQVSEAPSQRAASLLEGFREGCFTLDQAMVITYFNRSAEKLFGRARREVLGLPLSEAFPDVHRVIVEYSTHLIQERQPLDFEVRLDAAPYANWYAVHLYPLDDGLAVYFTIITGQKRMQADLQRSQEMLDLFFQQSLDGFFLMMLDEPITWNDHAEKDALIEYAFTHQRITKANEAILEQYGLELSDFIGLTPAHFFQHDPDGGRRVWHKFFDAGTLHVVTNERREDGAEMWIEGDYTCLYDDQGCIIGHFGVQRDITERVQAERVLRESEQRLDLILQCSDLGLWDWNIQTGFLHINARWAEMLGYKLEEIEPSIHSWERLIHADDLPRVMQAFHHHLDGESLQFECEYRMWCKNGASIWVLGRGKVLFWDEQNRPLRALGTNVDISEWKRVESVQLGM